MKKLVAFIGIGILVAACGIDNNNSDVSISLHHDTDTTTIGVLPLEGKVESVAVYSGRSDRGAPFTVTNVKLSFIHGCTSTLAPVSHKFVYNDDNTVDLYVSAFEKVSRYAREALCTKIPVSYETIGIDGFFNKEDITVHYNHGEYVETPRKLARVSYTDTVRLGQVKDICPDDADCLFNTEITLVVGTSGCVDKAALSYSTKVDSEGLHIYAGALNLSNKDSDAVRCFVQNTETFSFEIPASYDRDHVKLHVLDR